MAVVQTMEQGGLEKGVELSNTERHGLHSTFGSTSAQVTA